METKPDKSESSECSVCGGEVEEEEIEWAMAELDDPSYVTCRSCLKAEAGEDEDDYDIIIDEN